MKHLAVQLGRTGSRRSARAGAFVPPGHRHGCAPALLRRSGRRGSGSTNRAGCSWQDQTAPQLTTTVLNEDYVHDLVEPIPGPAAPGRPLSSPVVNATRATAPAPRAPVILDQPEAAGAARRSSRWVLLPKVSELLQMY
jgi:hypothetical protein